MHILIAVIEASSNAGAEELLRLRRPRKEQLSSSSQQRQLDTRRLTGKRVCERLQRVWCTCTPKNSCDAAASETLTTTRLGYRGGLVQPVQNTISSR